MDDKLHCDQFWCTYILTSRKFRVTRALQNVAPQKTQQSICSFYLFYLFGTHINTPLKCTESMHLNLFCCCSERNPQRFRLCIKLSNKLNAQQ